MIPRISIDYCLDSDTYTLVATSHRVTNPAGPRLFRGGDHPQIQFVHTDESSAKADAAKLQTYLDLAWIGKAPKAKGREEAEVAAPTKADFSDAVWMT